NALSGVYGGPYASDGERTGPAENPPLLRIETGKGKEKVYMSFRDNGPGIEERYYDKIFQIFQTLMPRDEHESTGIGLTLVKKIVALYGGSVWVESKSGKGAAFFFSLPKKGEKDEKL
ncbi:MAG: hypothetical protein KKA76_10500, partial [Proteobacteria bacterium]|nr:hypothetical protein [Pseudomonadota bacterium]